jgi:hypothetical protein
MFTRRQRDESRLVSLAHFFSFWLSFFLRLDLLLLLLLHRPTRPHPFREPQPTDG